VIAAALKSWRGPISGPARRRPDGSGDEERLLGIAAHAHSGQGHLPSRQSGLDGPLG